MLHADGVCGLHRSAGEDKYIMHNVRAKGQNSDKQLTLSLGQKSLFTVAMGPSTW